MGFHQDTRGDWVAQLDCGHRQHVRHRPPFQVRPWVNEEPGRASHLGTGIDCPLCDRGDVPDGLEAAGTSPTWDQDTLPAALQRDHRLAPTTWGRLRVLSGILRYDAGPAGAWLLEAGATRGIPPGVPHALEIVGTVRLAIDFYRVPAPGASAGGTAAAPMEGPAGTGASAGGDPACWANLVCPECGVIVGQGPHRPGCSTGATD